MKDNLDPILLFSVQYKNKGHKQMRGVYYLPQFGIGMDGLRAEGSVRSVARHIANTPQYVTFVPAEINPGSLAEEDVVSAICNWVNK